jgi:EF hand domain-containing protein
MIPNARKATQTWGAGMKSFLSGRMLILLLCATIGAASAQELSEEDPVVASAPLWDADHNGVYTCDEWKQYASRLFNLADRNRDGYVDAMEFKTIQQAAPMFKEADLAYFDDNRDGRLSRDEFVNKPNPLFARYDRNGDCKVTPQELKGTSSAAPPSGKHGGGRSGR